MRRFRDAPGLRRPHDPRRAKRRDGERANARLSPYHRRHATRMAMEQATTGARAGSRAALHESTQALWLALQRATRVRIHARSLHPGGWNARGCGDVRVQVRSSRRLIVEESGQWGDVARPVRFRGASAWIRITTGSLAIEEVRPGDTSPARLADLVPAGRAVWRSREPHVCGRDRYQVSVKLRADRVEVRWRIEGPGKAGILRCTYERTGLGRSTSNDPD